MAGAAEDETVHCHGRNSNYQLSHTLYWDGLYLISYLPCSAQKFWLDLLHFERQELRRFGFFSLSSYVTIIFPTALQL